MQTNETIRPYREPRQAAHEQIIVSVRGFGRYFLVKNLSQSGAGLAGDKILRPGEPVTLQFNGVTVQGTVRWSADRNTGIKFGKKLDTVTFRTLLKQVRPFKKTG